MVLAGEDNELQATPHNAYFKVFASRQAEKQKAFSLLQSVEALSHALWNYLVGLRKVMLPQIGEIDMPIEITPEYVLSLGEQIRRSALATYTLDEILERYQPNEVLAHYKPLESYLLEKETLVMLKSLQQTLRLKLRLSTEQWEQWQGQLKGLDLTTLEQLNETALTVDTLADFQASLQKRGLTLA